MLKNIMLEILAVIILLSGCMFIAKENDSDKVQTVGIHPQEAQKVIKIIDEQKPPDN